MLNGSYAISPAGWRKSLFLMHHKLLVENQSSTTKAIKLNINQKTMPKIVAQAALFMLNK